MKANASELSGVQRAAVLLMALGESEAAQVLRHMDAKEVQKVGKAMTTLGHVSREQVEQIVTALVEELENETAIGADADNYVRNVLIQALGEDKAGSMLDRILAGRNSKALEGLKWMDPRAIAGLIRTEHPQIIAIVLSYLEPDQAAEVLKTIPEQVRAEVMLRIATLEGIPPMALTELDEILERQFSGSQDELKSASVGGIQVVASILNLLDASTEQAVLSAIGSADAELGAKIQDLMFVFDDLANLDDRAMQTLLRDVQSDQLALALRGADPKLCEKIFKNMSQRAAQMLAEDMEARGPVRLADVEAAQKEILARVRKLADEGTIQFGGKGEEFI